MENSLQKSHHYGQGMRRSLWCSYLPLQKSIRGSDVDASLLTMPAWLSMGDLPSLAQRLTVIAYEDIGLGQPWSPRFITVISSGCCPEGLDSQKPAFSLPMSWLIWPFSPKSNSAYEEVDNLARPQTSGHLPILATPAWMDTTAEARTRECPRPSPLSTQPSWKLGQARLSTRKKFVIITISSRRYWKYERAWLKERKLDRLVKIWNPFLKKSHFPLDFFWKWYYINIGNAVVRSPHSLRCWPTIFLYY